MSDAHRCLTEKQLLDLVSGRCDEKDAALLLAEAERCPECTLILAEAGRAAAEVEGDAFEPSPFTASEDAFQVQDCVAGRYRIERVVGRGGMGEVYEVVDTELGQRLALKTIRSHLADQVTNIERFKREIVLARRVVHPNVCRVLEFGRHDDDGARPSYFLTMEFLQGELLSRRLRRDGPLPVAETLDIALQLATGLQAIHAEGILHRDIKTNNVMLCGKSSVSSDGLGPATRAVLLDFGVARSLDGEPVSLPAGGLIGTPDYMAPEQLEGAALSPATDVYAVGLVIFELLTGRLPSQAASSLVRAVNRLQAPPPPPSQFAPNLPRAVDDLVLWCLAPKPQDRPASATALLAALVSLRDQAAGLAIQVQAPRERPARRFGVRWLVLAAVLLLAVGLTAIKLHQPKARPVPSAAELARMGQSVRARVGQALAEELGVLETHVRTAARIPELRNAATTRIDAFTFNDLFATEEWWQPYRTLVAVVFDGERVLVTRGVPDLINIAGWRFWAANGGRTSSAVVVGEQKAYLAAGVPLEGNGPLGLVLGRALDAERLAAIARKVDARHLLLSDGKKIVGPPVIAQAAESASAVLTVLGREAEPAVMLPGGQMAVAVPLSSGVWLWTIVDEGVLATHAGS